MDSSGREEGRQEDSVEDMEVAMVKKRSAEVDSDTLLAVAEDVACGNRRVVEEKVGRSSPLFVDSDSDILLEAVEILLGSKKKSETVYFKVSNEEAERFLVETGEPILPLATKVRSSGYLGNIRSRDKVGKREVPLLRPKATHVGLWLLGAGLVAVPAKEAGPRPSKFNSKTLVWE